MLIDVRKRLGLRDKIEDATAARMLVNWLRKIGRASEGRERMNLGQG